MYTYLDYQYVHDDVQPADDDAGWIGQHTGTVTNGSLIIMTGRGNKQLFFVTFDSIRLPVIPYIHT